MFSREVVCISMASMAQELCEPGYTLLLYIDSLSAVPLSNCTK
jgi:hypothetical protein